MKIVRYVIIVICHGRFICYGISPSLFYEAYIFYSHIQSLKWYKISFDLPFFFKDRVYSHGKKVAYKLYHNCALLFATSAFSPSFVGDAGCCVTCVTGFSGLASFSHKELIADHIRGSTMFMLSCRVWKEELLRIWLFDQCFYERQSKYCFITLFFHTLNCVS